MLVELTFQLINRCSGVDRDTAIFQDACHGLGTITAGIVGGIGDPLSGAGEQGIKHHAGEHQNSGDDRHHDDTGLTGTGL